MKHIRKYLLMMCLLALFSVTWETAGLTARAMDDYFWMFGEERITSGTCGLLDAQVTWEYSDGVLTISGSGAIADYKLRPNEAWDSSYDEPPYVRPWEQYTREITEVVIGDGITAVGEAAFSNLYALQKATVASSVKTIRKFAFTNDEQLTEIDLGSGLEHIEDNALYDTGLTTLTLPSVLKQLDVEAVNGMWHLENYSMTGSGTFQVKDGVLFADGGKTLMNFPIGRTGNYAVPDGTTKILDKAFWGTNLSALTVADSVKEAGQDAFSYSKTLQSLVFPKGLKTIPAGICSDDDALVSVTIPEGVVEIEGYAFEDCTSLKKVTLPSTVTELDADVFPKDTEIEFKASGIHKLEDGDYMKAVQVNLYAKADYQEAFKVLDLVNIERKKAGVKELVMDKSLLSTAMLRAAETVLYGVHIRPTGKRCFTANDKMWGENVASGQSSAKEVMYSWMHSEGHRENILNGGFESIGIGCVYFGGSYYWVQCFGRDEAEKTGVSAWKNKNQTWKILVKMDPEYYSAKFSVSKNKLKVGESAEVTVKWSDSMKLPKSGVVIESSDQSVCKISGSKIKAVGPGKAKITVYFKDYEEKALKKTITVTGKKSAAAKSSVKVGKTAITGLTGKKGRKLAVKLKKVSGAAGYEIVCATDASFTKNKKKVRIAGISRTISGLKKGGIYYVKARAYKKNSAGKRVYGAYSKIKRVRIKK